MVLDASPETMGKAKGKAEYIADMLLDMLTSERTIPATTAADVLRQLEAIADTLDEYGND